MSDKTTIDAGEARTKLRGAFAMRAAAYAHMFDVLREEFGEDKALELGMKATRRLGIAMGAHYAEHGPADTEGLKTAFLNGIPEREAMFAPEVVRCDADELQIYFHRCPLKEAWQDMGRNDHDLALLCRMAGAIDGGLFTAAGFTFLGETWSPGESGCCRLRVVPGEAAAPSREPGSSNPDRVSEEGKTS